MTSDGMRRAPRDSAAPAVVRPRRIRTRLAIGMIALAFLVPTVDTSAASHRSAKDLIADWSATSTVKAYSEVSTRVKYRGTWRRAAHPGHMGGYVRFAKVRGAKATFTFIGTAVAWIGPVGPTRGRANVWIDGVLVKSVNTYARSFRPGRVLFKMDWATAKERRITIAVVGTKGHPVVAIDGFVVRSRANPAAASALPSATTDPAPVLTPSATVSAFVTRVGTTLHLNGRPFRFDGLNIYHAIAAPCWDMEFPLQLATDLPAIGSGQDVARVFAFQHTATTNGRRDWSYIDAALGAFAAHRVRVIMVLTDHWKAQPCADSSTDRTLEWYQTGYRTTTEGASTYRDWVAQIVTRYRDDPTIAMWQLVNEASAPNADGSCSWQYATDVLQAFANDMAGLVKRIDPNHLVSLGSLQGYCGGDTSSWAITQSGPDIDVLDYHDYGFPMNPLGDPGPNGFAASLARASDNDKALIVGEMGIGFASLATPTTAYRATLFDAKLDAQLTTGSSGGLLWAWSNGFSAVPPRDMEITYEDPAIDLLDKH